MTIWYRFRGRPRGSAHLIGWRCVTAEGPHRTALLLGAAPQEVFASMAGDAWQVIAGTLEVRADGDDLDRLAGLDSTRLPVQRDLFGALDTAKASRWPPALERFFTADEVRDAHGLPGVLGDSGLGENTP